MRLQESATAARVYWLNGYEVSEIIVARESYVLPLRGDLSATASFHEHFAVNLTVECASEAVLH